MKNRYTKINWNIEEEKKLKSKPRAVAKRKSGNVTTNYSIMLQLYMIQKQEAANKAGAKFVKTDPPRASLSARMSVFVMGVVPFFTRLFDMFSRENKPSVSIVTE